jgi:hypothetical protein
MASEILSAAQICDAIGSGVFVRPGFDTDHLSIRYLTSIKGLFDDVDFKQRQTTFVDLNLHFNVNLN